MKTFFINMLHWEKKILYELFLWLCNSYSGDNLSETSIVGFYLFHRSYF